MAFSGSNGGRRPLSEINVTPLVDVMLVLLIIFMVTAPLIQQGVHVDLPKTAAAPLDSKEDRLVLTLDAQKRIYLGKIEIPFADLQTRLAANDRVKKDKELYLHADQHLEYGFVMQVMTIAKQSGVEQLGMVTDPLQTRNP